MLNINLSSKIVNALTKSRPIGLNGLAKQQPNQVFSLKNPYILEAIPDEFIGTDVFIKLSKLEGKKMEDVLPIIDTFTRNSQAVSNPLGGTSSKVDLYEELAKLYEKVANRRIKAGESPEVLNLFAQKARNHEFSEKELYSNLYDELYNNIRKCDYPITKFWNHNISDITRQSNNYMMVQEAGGWHYRVPHRRHDFGWSRNDKAIDRISVNANTDKDLIAKLDEYFGSGKAKGYYKTPSDAASWLERHDPITIYLHESANPQILKDIENITRPHIRSVDDVLVGQKFAPGLALEKSPSTMEIEKLLAEISKVNQIASQTMRNALVGELVKKGLPKDSPLSASAGQMTAMKRLLELLR